MSRGPQNSPIVYPTVELKDLADVSGKRMVKEGQFMGLRWMRMDTILGMKLMKNERIKHQLGPNTRVLEMLRSKKGPKESIYGYLRIRFGM